MRADEVSAYCVSYDHHSNILESEEVKIPHAILHENNTCFSEELFVVSWVHHYYALYKRDAMKVMKDSTHNGGSEGVPNEFHIVSMHSKSNKEMMLEDVLGINTRRGQAILQSAILEVMKLGELGRFRGENVGMVDWTN